MSRLIGAIEQRWSPYRFEPRPIESEKLVKCLDAARWAASSYNDQPWHFIVARRENESEFEDAIRCLMEANQVWARNTSAILLSVVRTTFRLNGKPNRVALHDLGAAAAQFALQAVEEGLQVHQMAGVNLTQVRLTYGLPDGFEPQTAIAIGYPDMSPVDESDELGNRDQKKRERLAFDQFVFSGRWGQAAPLS